MQPLALQPPLHVGEREHDGVDLVGLDHRAQPVEGEVAVVGCAHRALPWSSCGGPCRGVIRAVLAAAPRCRRSAPASPGAPGPRGPPRIAETIRACWVSEWAMFASSTGIALSISCIVDCTDGHRLDQARGPGERGDGQVEARVGLPVHGRAAGRGDRFVRGLAGARAARRRACTLGGQAGARRAPRCGGSRGASTQSARREGVRRDAARADGVAGRIVTTVPPPRPRVVCTSPA